MSYPQKSVDEKLVSAGKKCFGKCRCWKPNFEKCAVNVACEMKARAEVAKREATMKVQLRKVGRAPE